ncbi:baculoviral IAP repeat-containing protein 3-like [Mytilus californianus]|uniref:baculoviral IAP repeat-containing protein 3-like n=1 Tax=Mytilus californianus TaxID=6549 RepID=UPI0022460039|nr:baculoviral IAP repeat-containing protein 3-like [Mytilus californianus]
MLSMMNRLNIHDHHGGYDEVPQHPLDRLEPLRNDKILRKNTFNSWPKDTIISHNILCEDGFYYIGISDKVQCAYCGGVLSGWQKGDDVHEEHKRHFGKCPQVRGDTVSYDENDLEIDCAPDFSEYTDQPDQAQQGSPVHQPEPHNFGFQNEQKDDLVEKAKPVPVAKVHNSKYALYSTRLESYENWPSDHHLKPNDLASAGLYYKGSEDKCQCFMCGGILAEWEMEDIPKDEHKKWFPKCYNSMDNE